MEKWVWSLFPNFLFPLPVSGGRWDKRGNATPNIQPPKYWEWGTATQISTQVLPRWSQQFWNAVNLTDPMVSNPFQCLLATIVDLWVSIQYSLTLSKSIWVSRLLLHLFKGLAPGNLGLTGHPCAWVSWNQLPPCCRAQRPGPGHLDLTRLMFLGFMDLAPIVLTGPRTQARQLGLFQTPILGAHKRSSHCTGGSNDLVQVSRASLDHCNWYLWTHHPPLHN